MHLRFPGALSCPAGHGRPLYGRTRFHPVQSQQVQYRGRNRLCYRKAAPHYRSASQHVAFLAEIQKDRIGGRLTQDERRDSGRAEKHGPNSGRLKDAGIEMDITKMEGQIAIAVSSNDEVEAAKIIAKAAKANENLKIAGGVLGSKVLSQEEVIALSKLLSKEDLLAKLVGSLKSPISGLANVLAGNMRGLVQVLKAISESKA